MLAGVLLERVGVDGKRFDLLKLRSMTINLSSALMPLLFGALGAAVGASTLFWVMGAAVGAGSVPARRIALPEPLRT